MVAGDYLDFAAAMTEKLVRELRSVPLALGPAPASEQRVATSGLETLNQEELP